MSGCLHIICGFWPSSPSHLAGNKHSILSKTRLRAHYCLGISRLLLRWLLKYNFSVIINDTTISKTKIWPLTTCCVCSPLGGRRDEGQKRQMICKQPDKTINIKYLRYLVRSRKQILTSQNDDQSDKNIKHWKNSFFDLLRFNWKWSYIRGLC